jgi:hypothetical protein
MTLEYTKASFAAVWVLAICVIGLAGEVTFAGRMVLTAVAVLPPLAMWRLLDGAPTKYVREHPRGHSMSHRGELPIKIDNSLLSVVLHD